MLAHQESEDEDVEINLDEAFESDRGDLIRKNTVGSSVIGV